MDRSERKAAVAAYKEKKPVAGVFAVRCAPSGEVWVGRSTHLDTQQTSLWFQLKHGGSPHRGLLAAWRRHGAEAFSFEALDRAPDELTAIGRGDFLKARAEHWRAALGAATL